MEKLESQSRVACTQCKNAREKTGKTYCSAEKLDKFPKPKNCPTENEIFKCQIAESLDLYKKNSEDCKLSNIAAKVEGLGYSKTKKTMLLNLILQE